MPACIPPSVRGRALRAACLLGFVVSPLAAQTPAAAPTGRITGRIIDAATGAGLSDAGIQVVGTALGVMSGVDGRFTLVRVPAGTVTLQVRLLGYQAKTVTGLLLPAGGGLEQDISLKTATVQLAAQTVSATVERGSVNDALDKQRTATGIINSITAEQIAKSPDGDAAQAIQRVSGVTVQDGRSVFVRGVGERYTTTSLNGARLPSPEPEKRFVPLDIFPTALLQTITTAKTFTPDLSGDFSGAQIDIQTREFPVRRAMSLSFATGVNDAATGRQVLAAPRSGGELLALANGARNVPDQLRTGAGIAQLTTRPAMNAAINSLRSAWTPTTATGLPNSSVGFSIGGQDPILGLRIGYVGSLTYGLTQEVRADDQFGNPQLRDGRVQEFESWRGSGARLSTLWGGMLNLSSLVSRTTRISLNNTYTRTADNEARVNAGPTFAYSLAEAERVTTRYVERAIRSTQLRGEHELGRSSVDWNLSTSGVARREPDRTDLALARFSATTPFEWGDGNPDQARRTFGDLTENNTAAALNWKVAFGPVSRQAYVKVGGTFRATERDAFNRQFAVISTTLPQGASRLPVNQLFDGRFTGPTDNVFNLLNVAEDGSYDATERLSAGYAMTELPVGDRVRVIFGARLEQARITVNSALTNGTRSQAVLDNTDVLPSLVVNVKPGERTNLRFSATQTLARPEYRELAPVQYLEVVGGFITRGNANLTRTLVRNVDAKWEFFPSAGEVLSLGVFGKQFIDPIERIDQATGSQPLITFANADAARNLGVELEARKNLGTWSPRLDPFSVFTNLTVMTSRIDIGEGISANTNTRRPMMGQAPWVANAGGSWSSRSGAGSVTLLYSAVGPRINFAGTIPFPDTYEQTRHLVDLSLRFPVVGGVSGKVDLRNLLDAPFALKTGEVIRERFRMGRVATVGLTWKP
jgi:hypothetical protein